MPRPRPGPRRPGVPALLRHDDLDEGLVALPGLPLQGGLLRLSRGVAARRFCPYAGKMHGPVPELSVAPTAHTAAAVRAVREARGQVPCHGSLCAALDLADPAGTLDPAAYHEAVGALDVAARVF